MESRGYRYLGYENTLPDFQVVPESLESINRQPGRYCFADSLGNTLVYSIATHPRPTLDVVIELCECETSNPNDYEWFCGDDGVMKQVLVEQRKGNTKMNFYERTAVDSIVGSVQSRIRNQGFELTSFEFKRKDSYQKRQDNYYYYKRQSSYHFVDTMGNVLIFSVFHNDSKGKSRKSNSDRDAKLCGFEVSDPNVSDEFWGVIKQTLKDLDYSEAIRSIQSYIGNQGYQMKGYKSDLTGHYSDLRQSTYYFADGLGNTMDYSVCYIEGTSTKGDYVYSESCGCETSNPDDFERLCGENGVLKPMNNLPKDLNITRDRIAGAFLGIAFSTLIFAPSIIYAIIVYGK